VDPEVTRWIGDGSVGDRAQAVAAIERADARWAGNGFGPLAVERREDGRMVGRVGLLLWDARTWRHGTRDELGDETELEIGWALARAYWGNGYATEAALALRDWTLRELAPPRLVSLIHPENVRSQRVAARIGERYERDIVTWRGIVAQLWTT
jgi:RimJ/RimL family protein N-acetyltransferase